MHNLFRKNIILILTAVLLSGISVSSASEETTFQKGNEYYQQKQYDKAIETYEKLVKSDYEGASLYYNLGNAYYRTGKVGYAILYYEKALKLSPSDDDIVHNLDLANLKIIDKVESFPEFFLFQWWEGLLSFLSSSGWTITAYIFYLVLIFSIGCYFFVMNPLRQKIILITGVVALFLFLVTAVLLTVKMNRELNAKNGIIVENTVNVKISPDSGSNDAFIVHEGLKVALEDKVDNWIKVRLQDGKIGWIPDQDVKII
jgi:tetratricopeptide (TPR) repeat protein